MRAIGRRGDQREVILDHRHARPAQGGVLLEIDLPQSKDAVSQRAGQQHGGHDEAHLELPRGAPRAKPRQRSVPTCSSSATSRGACTDCRVCPIDVVDVFQIVNFAQGSCFGNANSPYSQAFYLEGVFFTGLGECATSPANTDTCPEGTGGELDKPVPGKSRVHRAL